MQYPDLFTEKMIHDKVCERSINQEIIACENEK
jgi:hypothetical protein